MAARMEGERLLRVAAVQMASKVGHVEANLQVRMIDHAGPCVWSRVGGFVMGRAVLCCIGASLAPDTTGLSLAPDTTGLLC